MVAIYKLTTWKSDEDVRDCIDGIPGVQKVGVGAGFVTVYLDRDPDGFEDDVYHASNRDIILERVDSDGSD